MEVGTLIEVDSLDSERLLALNSTTSFFPPIPTTERGESMRKSWILLVALVAVLDFSAVAIAALSTIGTASYGGSSYNLIYEDDQGLVWLDYTNGPIYSGGYSWPTQVNWASRLNNSGVLAYNINPGISVNWAGDWRLPETADGPWVYGNDGTTTAGFNVTSSEMGHLYYVSLGNLGPFDTSGNPQPGYGLQNTGPFNNLLASHAYWSGTEYSLDPYYAWGFDFGSGHQNSGPKYYHYLATAVRSGEVSAVPVPASVLLLASGLIGLVGLRRMLRK